MRLRYQKHSETSMSAAIESLRGADNQRGRVFRFIEDSGHFGATDEEIQLALGMNPSTQRPRRVELVEDLLVVRDSGRRRKTTSGRSAVVWEVIPTEPVQREFTFIRGCNETTKEKANGNERPNRRTNQNAERDREGVSESSPAEGLEGVSARVARLPVHRQGRQNIDSCRSKTGNEETENAAVSDPPAVDEPRRQVLSLVAGSRFPRTVSVTGYCTVPTDVLPSVPTDVHGMEGCKDGSLVLPSQRTVQE